MPKTKISEFSSTPASNTDIDSINIAEGCAPSGINDAIRELMAQLKDFQTGAVGDSFNGPVGTTTAAAGAFTTLSASGAVTLSGGTANGVTYLNGSKVVTSGSALAFDGTNFVNGSGGVRAGTNSGSGGALSAWGGASGATIDITPSTVSGANGVTYNTSFISGGSGPHIFSIGGSEQMRLTSTGLGIGTSSPNYSLTSYKSGAVANYIQVASGATGAGSGNGLLLGVDSSGNSVINAQGSGSGNMLFYTSTAEKMRLDSSGNLGLGVTPSAWAGSRKALQIGGNTVSTVGLTNTIGEILYNNFFNGTNFIYSNTGYASSFDYNNATTGGFAWRLAASGTAGNAITFTQAMTLTAEGNLGIGITSPTVKLDVQAGNVSAANDATALRLYQAGDGGVAMLFTNGVSNLVRLAGTVTSAGAGTDDGVFTIQTASNSVLAERARIDSSGVLLVGSTSSSGASRFIVKGSGASSRLSKFLGDTTGDLSNASVLFSKYDNNSTTSQVFLQFSVNNDTTANGQINANGASQVAFGSWSDARLKENIVGLPSQLSNIMALRPVEFDYIASEGGGHQIGFIAQEMETVFSDAVGERSDGMKTVTGWGKTEAILVKAIQEQQAIIESLKARLDAANL